MHLTNGSATKNENLVRNFVFRRHLQTRTNPNCVQQEVGHGLVEMGGHCTHTIYGFHPKNICLWQPILSLSVGIVNRFNRGDGVYIDGCEKARK